MTKSSFGGILGNYPGKWPFLAGGILTLLIVVAVFLNGQRGEMVTQAQMESYASQVSIGNPLNGSEAAAFTPVTVNAMAIGPAPFLSMELWINGELMSVQAGPSQGKTPLSANFIWIPKEEGTFNLVAQTTDANGQVFASPGVSVLVSAGEDELGPGEAFADFPAVSPALGGGGFPSPSAPDPEHPAKPELAISIDSIGCSLELLIHDLSDNEEGFAIYRNDTTSGQGYKKIATLPSQSANEWINFAEDVWALGYINANYYVVAFNSQGESKSNIAFAVLDTIDCLVDPPEDSPNFDTSLLAVQIQGLQLLNVAPPDRLYCYRSIDHGLWTRWPASDYFYPLPDGSFSINEVLSAILLELDSGPTELSITLDLECWGWYGNDLQYLGSLHHDGQDLGFGDSTIIGDGIQVVLGFQQLDGAGPFYQFDAEFGDFSFGEMDKVFKWLIDPQMQFVQAQVTYNPDLCENHLPAEFQNLFGRILFCFPYPGFHGSFAEGDNPQPYLIWDFWNQCKDGYGIEPDGFCKSYQAYLDQAAANNGKVGFIVHDWSSAGYHHWIVDAPNLRMFNIPPNGCAGTRTFMVQMFYEEDGWTQYSPNGNEWPIECPKPVGNVVTLEFVFDSMTLADMDDDDSGAQTVEVFGYFQVQAPSSQLGSNNFLKMGAWDEQWSDCPDDTDYFTSNPPGSCTQRFTMGTYSLANVPLCKSSDYTESDKFHCYSHFGNSSTQDLYSTNNNRLRVEVQDGDAITLMVVLKDWDDSSANDTACWGFNDLGSKTVFEWDAMDGAGFSLFGFGDTENGGNCSISGTINVLD